MQLSYRGVSYERVLPPIKTVKGEVIGKYRGAPWNQQVLESIPVIQPAHSLKYRGVLVNPLIPWNGTVKFKPA